MCVEELWECLWPVCGGMSCLFVEELWECVLMCLWEYAVLGCLWRDELSVS
jgi:hypothetical protein